MEGGFSVLEGPMIGFSRERLLELVAMKLLGIQTDCFGPLRAFAPMTKRSVGR